MRETTRLFIPIPKRRNTQLKVEVDGDDVTGKVIESSWMYPATIGIGTFKIRLSNAGGQISNLYNEGEFAKLFADNSDGTTLQFFGRIDYVKDVLTNQGQFLDIEGRHRSYLLTEFLISHSATATATSQILKDIIDKLPASFGFTKTNIETDTTTMDVSWNYKPFWDCVVELTGKAGFDCYVDNDLDFHYFEENSKVNTDDVISEGNNFLKTIDWGADDYTTKTRVIAVGQNEDGLPIVYTDISSGEGTDIREVFIKDASANTLTEVRNIAESKLAELETLVPQASIESYGLESVTPGQNILILVPRQKIAGQYKILQLKHQVGMKFGGWRTVSTVEREQQELSLSVRNVNKKGERAITGDNINKLNFSWNFDYDEDVGVHSATQITEGVLKSTGSSGTWISPLNALDSNATKVEIRARGEQIPGTVFSVSIDNGVSYQALTLNTLLTLSPPGPNLKIKVEINSSATQLYSVVLLYS